MLHELWQLTPPMGKTAAIGSFVGLGLSASVWLLGGIPWRYIPFGGLIGFTAGAFIPSILKRDLQYQMDPPRQQFLLPPASPPTPDEYEALRIAAAAQQLRTIASINDPKQQIAATGMYGRINASKEEIEAYWARVPKPQGQPKRQRRTVEEPPVDFYPSNPSMGSMGGGMFSDAEYNEISGESTYDDEFASAKTTLETTYNQRFDPENDSEITKSLFDL
jgi:hypothetical protein